MYSFDCALSVYPCTHRERLNSNGIVTSLNGISLYPQGTRIQIKAHLNEWAVYPCTHRERFELLIEFRINSGISLYPQGTLLYFHQYVCLLRYIPVPTGNAIGYSSVPLDLAVYPCTHRERLGRTGYTPEQIGISLYLQGTLSERDIRLQKVRYIPVPTGNSLPV